MNCSRHPVIWKFIETLQMEQAKNEFIIVKYNAGEDEPQQKKYKNQQECLKSVVSGRNWVYVDITRLIIDGRATNV